MTEQTPDDVTRQIKKAEERALAMIARQRLGLDEIAADLRGMVFTLSDKELFAPDIWQQGYEEIEDGVATLKSEWRSLQLMTGPSFLKQLKGLGIHPEAQQALSNCRSVIRTLPPEMAAFYREYKVFKGRFFEDRVVFLDIDGVLLTTGNWLQPDNFEFVISPVEERMDKVRLDPRSTAFIVRLCDLANASLVLASSWRRTWPYDHGALLDHLVEQGLRRDLWHENWMLPVLPGQKKWQELAKWTEAASNLVGLIIDDEKPDDPPPLYAVKAEILQVSAREGFGFYNYVDALEFFNVEDSAVKVPPSIPPRGRQFYPTMGNGGPSRRSAASVRPGS